MSHHTSITDKPITSVDQDKLKSKRYALALTEFISHSDTPMTVGLQGEWGTGKTSMMYMLREQLKAKDIATSWVNTWEYSMFRGAAETTPAVLRGMLEKLIASCEAEGQWTLKDEGKQTMRKVGKFFTRLGNQAIANKTGLDIMDAASGDDPEVVQAEIADVKEDIKDVISKLLDDPANRYKRVVFFVDDLDRIPPTDAVEVLEALKNMFDIPNCIFVLAIDYEVVVKGLEGKFGEKTEENEREFRSFFDKIIQVPFSMPTGAYTIDELMQDKLAGMGIQIPDDYKDEYAKVVGYTVGFNPRSLKRYLNSFSLLRSLRDADFRDDPEAFDGDQPDAKDDLMLFSLLGLQISYPKIFRFLVQDIQYVDWEPGMAEKLSVNLTEVAETVSKFGDGMKGKTDEVWEQIIYGFCNRDLGAGKRDPYLKAKWESIVDLLNLLRDTFSLTEGKKEEDVETLYDLLGRSMSFAAITNVDDDVAGKSGMEKRGKVVRFDSMESKYNFLKEDPSINQKALPLWRSVGEMFEAFVAERDCAIKVTASYMPLNKGRDKVAKLHNCKAKKLIIKGHVYHPVGDPAPEGNPHIEFKEGGKSIPDQWSFTLYSADGLPRLREVIANRIDELS